MEISSKSLTAPNVASKRRFTMNEKGLSYSKARLYNRGLFVSFISSLFNDAVNSTD
jgi:hypothetical protein